jgi:hypothetical protein
MNAAAPFGPEARAALALPEHAWRDRPVRTSVLVRALSIGAIAWGCLVATGCLTGRDWGHRDVQRLADLCECGAWVGFGFALRRGRAVQIRHTIAILAMVWGARILIWVAIRLLEGHQGAWLANVYGICWMIAGVGLYGAHDWGRRLCIGLSVVICIASVFSVVQEKSHADFSAMTRWPALALVMLTYCRLRSVRNQVGPSRLSA